jgi:hypothetical protein
MTGYVGETNNLKRRCSEHKRKDKWPGRPELVNKINPVIIKADFKNITAVRFAEHAAYEMYKEKGYDMLQKPPHPNIFTKYKDRVDECKICDELGCDFTKEKLEYILVVHRVSKLCDYCQEPFYFDPVKHKHITTFNRVKCCSKTCEVKKKWDDPEYRLNQTERNKGENSPSAKITHAAAICIKTLLKYTKLKHKEIATMVEGATLNIVRNISCGKNWKDIDVSIEPDGDF